MLLEIFINHYDWLYWSQFVICGVFSVFLGCFLYSTLLLGRWVCSTFTWWVPFLLDFSQLLSDWELVRLVFLVALKCSAILCISCCFDALHGNCGDWYDWFYWSYCNIRLFCVHLGYFGLLLKICYNRYDWFSWSYLNLGLNPVFAVVFSFYA